MKNIEAGFIKMLTKTKFLSNIYKKMFLSSNKNKSFCISEGVGFCKSIAEMYTSDVYIGQGAELPAISKHQVSHI